MNVFEIVLLDVILLAFPLIIWLLMQVYIKVVNKEKINLLFDVSLFTSTYLVLRYGIMDNEFLPFLLLNVPLILGFYKKRNITVLLLLFISLSYYNKQSNTNIIIVGIVYLIYYVIYLVLQKNNKNDLFIKLFIMWKIIITLIFSFIGIIKITSSLELIKVIAFILTFYIMMNFILYLFKQEERLISLHLKIDEVQENKNITDSLFKITHEIKNPIAVCKGYLDMFDVNDVNHSKKYVPILKEEIKRTLILLEDFLSINRVKIKKELIDINFLLEEVLDNFKPILEAENIKVEFNISDDEVYMMADYNRLNQVIVNVIKNSMEAIKETKNDYIKIYTEKDKKNFKIYVEDNGKGISKENMEKMNQPFFTTKRNGTGLGVYLSREIINLHNGTMIYKSKEGVGTKVIITLPFNK